MNFNWNYNNLMGIPADHSAAAAARQSKALAALYDDSGRLWLALGHSLVERGFLSQSLLCFQSALACDPELDGVQAIRGFVLFRLGRYEEAMSAYMTALAEQADDADVWLNLGVLFQACGHLEEALSCFVTALFHKPGSAMCWSNRAKAERALGDFAAAAKSFACALKLAPNDAVLRVDLALSLLSIGDFANGWRAYDTRFQLANKPGELAGRWPLWAGEPVDGKRILIVTEQGLGDIFQFVRYVERLQALGAEVTLRVSSRMIPVLRGMLSPCELVSELEPDTTFDFETALMSLPYRLTPTSVLTPDPLRYIAADPDRAASWAKRLASTDDTFRVGIAWQGNPFYQEDRKRSFALSEFAAVAEVPHVRLVSLQQQYGVEQLADCAFAVEQIEGTPDRDGAFVDTAAIIDSLDLVITSDSAIAHLAGALGKTVWLALPFVPDWRWGVSGETTDWYPTMRLFRQTRDGDWASVFAEIASALEALVTD